MEKTSRVEVPGFPRRSKINQVLGHLTRSLRRVASQLHARLQPLLEPLQSRLIRLTPTPAPQSDASLPEPAQPEPAQRETSQRDTSPPHPLQLALPLRRFVPQPLARLALRRQRYSLPGTRFIPQLQRLAQLLFQLACNWQGRLRDLAFPAGCGRCGAPILDHERWCRDCRQVLGVAAHPPLAKSQCPRCAAIRPPEACSPQGCLACADLDLPFDSVSALGSYHGGLRRWVIDVKRTLDPPLIAALAQALVEDLAARGIDRQIDLVIPVPPRRLGIPASNPSTATARRSSGFFAPPPADSSDTPPPPPWPPRLTSPAFWVSLWKTSVLATHQLVDSLAWLPALGSRHGSLPTHLAERIALALGLPLLTNLVQYRRPTRKQGQLRIADRLRNVRHAMALRRFARPARVAGKRILLVDDVLTSGATLAELARVLRLAGASQIHVVVLARAAADR